MSRFITIDLSNVPPPPIIAPLDFETIRSATLTNAVARLAAAGIAYDVEALESDPLVKTIEAWAARELLLRAGINDAVRAVLLPSSWGQNIDSIGALVDTPRLPGESDEAYRARVHIAPEAFSSAGPVGAYEYFALTQLPGLSDASAVMIAPGMVRLTLLYPAPVFQPTQDQINQLAIFFKEENAKPLTDMVTIAGPKIVNVDIAATLTLLPGPDASVIQARAQAALSAFVAQEQRLGVSLACSAIIAALQQPGVKSVHLQSPLEDVAIDAMSVYNITSTSLTISKLREA